MNLLRWLFGTGDFMSHGNCYMWNPALVRLHLFSDIAIGVAYVAISLTLAYLVRSGRREIPFHWMFLAFGTFIIACAGTHLMEVWTLWTPVYWFSGVVKALTAVASVATAFALPPLVPRSLALVRSAKLADSQRQDLERMNQALNQEVTERRRAEAEIRKLNEELESRVEQRTAELARANLQLAEKAVIVQHSQDAIFSQTLEGVITSWNPAAELIYGHAAGEVVGKNIALLVPPDQANELSRIMMRLQAGDQIPPFEAVRLRKDGQRIDVSTTVSPIRDDTGVICGASVIARDITAHKKSEQQLREMQKLESLGLIAGGVAHDFNNLLVGILGNASLALDLIPASSPNHQLIEDVVTASEKAAHLTQQLLAYTGKGRFVTQKVDLSELVREISALVQTSIPKLVQLRLELADGLPVVDADPGQLQQLIMNLVINGAEAVPEGQSGTVLVTTNVQEVDSAYIERNYTGLSIEPGLYVSLEVHDTGVGMDERVKSRMFDPFFTTKFTGRGLGLSAVLGIVRGHKGTMRVYSEPGKGFTLKVLLPAVAGKVERAVADLETELRGTGLVLVVDDEDIVRKVAKAMLERYGYSVLLANDGQSGVDVFRGHVDRIGLVLLDMTMPVMSGEEAFRQIRIIKPQARVIISSGYNEVEAVRRFTAKGIAAFIQKPYVATKLARLVKRVIESEPTKESGPV